MIHAKGREEIKRPVLGESESSRDLVDRAPLVSTYIFEPEVHEPKATGFLLVRTHASNYLPWDG